MIFDRQQQRLLLEGKEYTFEDISQLIAGGAEAHSSAYWNLYLFLNEWFNDSPVITVHTNDPFHDLFLLFLSFPDKKFQ